MSKITNINYLQHNNVVSLHTNSISNCSQPIITEKLQENLITKNLAFYKKDKLTIISCLASYMECFNDKDFLNSIGIKKLYIDTFTNQQYIEMIDSSTKLLDQKALNNLYLSFSYVTNQINRLDLTTAINILSNEHSLDCIANYFNSLHWDGKERIKNFFTNYVKTTHKNQYNELLSYFLFNSIVSRSMAINKHVKVDTSLVLLGKKGLGKSSLAKILAIKNEWFTEISFSKMTDARRLMQGKIVCEIPELTGYSRSSIEDIKAFMTTSIDKWIEKYQTNETSIIRRSIFIMTSNDLNFLRESGDRRFAPVEITNINLNAIKEDLNQLYAEAYTYYLNNRKINYSDLEELILREQTQYMQEDPWDEIILKMAEDSKLLKSVDVLNALGIPKESQGQRHLRRINSIFERLNFSKIKKQGFYYWRK